MSRIISAVFVMIVGFSAHSQTYPVDTILQNGKPWELLSFTFMSEGYRASELDKYIADVNRVTNHLFNQSPFKEYKNYFNVYAIKVPSNESGANHFQFSPDPDCITVPIDTVDNAFSTAFDNFFIHRLVIPGRFDILYDAYVSSFPFGTQIVVLVNSPYYGGSGGNFPTITSILGVEDVLTHELGHSFANLADEYWVSEVAAEELPNMTKQNNPTLVKWKNWVGSQGVGVYPFEESPIWFRPHQSCKMRQLGAPFCSVCTEAIVETIHSMFWIRGPILDVLPSPGFIVPNSDDLELKLVTINPEPNTLKITWRLNSNVIAKNTQTVFIPNELINDGKFKTIRAELMDTTRLVRRADHVTGHLYFYEWAVDGIITGVEIGKVLYSISIWPNPFSNQLNTSFLLDRATKVGIQIADGNGKEVHRIKERVHEPGEYTYKFDASNKGMLIIRLSFDGTVVTEKVIRN